MNELIDIKPDINISESEYKRLLGYPYNYKLEGRARELADWARQWYSENGKPWIFALPSTDLDFSFSKLRIDNAEFASGKLRHQFAEAQVEKAMLVIVSAGKECEEKARELWEEGKPDEYFFLEIFGSAVVEHLITNTGARFCAWADENKMAVLPHYSPGYPGWNVTDQKQLLQLIIQRKTTALPGEIYAFETGMLNPKKSLLAVFGVTKKLDKVSDLRELVPCENCSLLSCQFRRIPYKHSRAQIEDVTRMQGFETTEPEFSSENNDNDKNFYYPVLIQNAKYSINSKALLKWSREKLQVKYLDDNSVEARFRYEGTTCSNMGRRLEFDYYIKLGPASEGYKIIELNCSPAPGDTGYTDMCEYIKDPESLMNSIETEKPLLGKPLNDILNREKHFSPEGCYCKAESRDHKWGLAFEVLHYALVQHEIEELKLSRIAG
ncbi:MAG: hypothetical protein R6W90_04510 [Ignavibacteriaceae bacterium]